jgi:hypothetical protein
MRPFVGDPSAGSVKTPASMIAGAKGGAKTATALRRESRLQVKGLPLSETPLI